MSRLDLGYDSVIANPFIDRNLIDRAVNRNRDLSVITQAQVDRITRRYNPNIREGFSDEDAKLCVDEICYLCDTLGAYKGVNLHMGNENIKSFLCDITKVGMVLYYLNGVPKHSENTINKLKSHYNLLDVGDSSN